MLLGRSGARGGAVAHSHSSSSSSRGKAAGVGRTRAAPAKGEPSSSSYSCSASAYYPTPRRRIPKRQVKRPLSTPLCAVSDFRDSDLSEFGGETEEAAALEVTLRPGESLLHLQEHVLDKKRGWTITVSVTVTSAEDGPESGSGGSRKVVRVVSNHPGNLILHWGVSLSPSSSQKSKGKGWYLPLKRDESSLPLGTTRYKKRALQSPFSDLTQHGQEVVIELKDGSSTDASSSQFSHLDFVVKDTTNNEWYNHLESESNFRVPLCYYPTKEGEEVAGQFSTPHRAAEPKTANDKKNKQKKAKKAKLQAWEIPELPVELCGIWAYVKWEFSGCPERSTQDADQEYKRGIQEMKAYLMEGYSMEELWKVARGEVKLEAFYRETRMSEGKEEDNDEDFVKGVGVGYDQDQVVVAEGEGEIAIPEELINVQAYILWERAGKPDGADFGQEAREVLESKVKGLGWTIEQVERDLKNPKAESKTRETKGSAASEEREERREEEEEKGENPLVLPEKLVALQAYILWEQAGKPEGADFTEEARQEIENMLVEKGMTVGQIESHFEKLSSSSQQNNEQKKTLSKKKQEARSVSPSPPPAPAPPAAAAPESKKYNPMKWIKPEKKDDKTANNDVPNLVNEALESENAKESPLEELIQAATLDSSSEGNVTWKRVYQMGNSCNLLAVVRDESEEAGDENGNYVLTLTTDLPNKVELHWGILKQGKPGSRNKWHMPDLDIRPSKSTECEDGISVNTVFGLYRAPPKVPLQQISVRVPKQQHYSDIFGVSFVLKSLDATQWWKDGGHSNFVVPFPNQNQQGHSDQLEDALVDEIVDREHKSAWTLMHRFNACSELSRSVMEGNYYDGNRGKGFSTLYVWLRYSSTRQLTWQRNYNTQPRFLSGAQENLTLQLTRSFRESAEWGSAQQWIRMCMSCVGKGGSNGQKIRDDILHIMHRHKVKEVKGTWMEEWHQKLHNNTTPDDVPICEAYISFLESGGSRDVYWRVLSDAGITRERLESFDRPIRCEPEDFPDKREGMINDFRDYLRVLKSVHSGTDLQTAASACQSVINGSNDLKSSMGYVLSHAGNNASSPESARAFIQCAVDARAIMHDMGAFYNTHDEGRQARDCLYLDAALESQIRACAESAAGSLRTDSSGWMSAAQLVGPLMQNLVLSTGDNSELCYCLQAWHSLPEFHQGMSKEDALLVSSVVDRMKRAVGDLSEKTTIDLQPVAQSIGSRTDCDQWTVELFSEEVVRGGPAFSVSLVLSMLEPSLRSLADLGAWQIISPAQDPELVAAKVIRSEQLYTLMHERYDQPTCLVCDRVTGEEEIPEGCIAVLTRDSPDMLSHIAVRARNEKVLLATCHDEEEFSAIKQNEAQDADSANATNDDGMWFAITTTGSGSVTYARCTAPQSSSSMNGNTTSSVGVFGNGKTLKISAPKWTGKYVVGMDDFKDEVVGAKSKNLTGLRNKIPEWINLPSSLTIPFGTFEHVLADFEENREVSEKLKALLGPKKEKGAVEEDPERVLDEAKQIAMEVEIPEEMWRSIVDGMRESGIDWQFDSTKKDQRDQIATAIKSVWASKFNLRAYYSLSKARLDFMDVRMAVLIQKVVNAKYAFVIHTLNPSTGDAGEIYCEVVKGLGEVLVGNYPGRALSFTCNKRALEQHLKGQEEQSSKGMITLESFPSKSVGLYLPESLMFRSDSNGEDLEGYAGAGLYDSVPLHCPEPQRVDYSNDQIMTDLSFRNELLTKIARVGLELEKLLESPQDIEGCVDEEGNVFVVQTRPQM